MVARDRDALALPARELVRIAVELQRIEPDPHHRASDELGDRAPAEFGRVGHQRLGDDLAGRHARIERGQRILEHDLEIAAQRTARAPVEPCEIATEPGDRAGRRRHQAEDRARQGRLAAARFADHAERLARRHREAHPVERAQLERLVPDPVGRHRVGDREVADLEQRAHPSAR